MHMSTMSVLQLEIPSYNSIQQKRNISYSSVYAMHLSNKRKIFAMNAIRKVHAMLICPTCQFGGK